MLKQLFVPCLVISCVLLFLLQPIYSLCESESVNRKVSFHHRVLLSHESDKYAVIFDAGSTGSRVHVFGFDQNLDLLRFGQDFELFLSVRPGLSSYADDPKAAAQSIEPLLEKAEATVPTALRSNTPIKLGATAGLRLLKGGASEKILEAVRDLIKNASSFKYKPEWVTILEGSQEAAYFWVAINYLLGKTGKSYSNTVGTIDLGGGSVQMTYAVSKENAIKASNLSIGGEKYVQERNVMGTTYHLYAKSYLGYGQLAARSEILKISRNSSHPCVVGGYNGIYTYNGAAYKASSLPSGASLRKCRAFVQKALKINAPCKHNKCTFNGVWGGSGGPGQKNLYVSSFFHDIATEVGILQPNVPSGRARPVDYLAVAKRACMTKYSHIKSAFPNIEERDIPYVCMDLVYQYTLLVDGFGLKPSKKITLVSSVKYRNSLVGAAWPLGSAIDAISSST